LTAALKRDKLIVVMRNRNNVRSHKLDVTGNRTFFLLLAVQRLTIYLRDSFLTGRQITGAYARTVES